MQVLIVFVARHKRALKEFEKHGIDLLKKGRMPASIADRIAFITRTYNPDTADGVSLEKFIEQDCGCHDGEDKRKVDGVVILFEETLGYLLARICNAVFAAQVPAIPYLENVRNFLVGKFSVLLGNYGLLMDLMQDATRYQAASLPIRNFDAVELRALANVCRTRSLERTFRNEIIPSFNRLLNLRGPKRRSRYPHLYFKDTCDRYFKYGYETHSRYETGGVHNLACLINGRFRFGGQLDQDRHFNVSLGDSDTTKFISSEMPNCHDAAVEVKDRTHLNMFSNDFHK